MENQKNIVKKPKWLRKLEKQSWQAELVVSGVAIYGALQLPSLVNRFANWALLNLSDDVLSFGFLLFFQYLNFASLILLFGFFIHFIMRTLWIGMIGLVSVYPNGVVKNSNRYSESYSDQLVNEFKDINGFNKKLDDTCSVILSSTIVGFLTMLIFNFWIIIGLYLWVGLKNVLGETSNIVFMIVIGVFILTFFLFIIMSDKKHRDKKWVKKIHYPITSKFTKYFFLVFYKTYAYISYTISTNYKKEVEVSAWKMLGIGIAFGVLGFLSVSLTDSTNQRLFSKESYHRFQSYPDDSYSENYQNNISDGEYQFGPSIQSEIVLDDFLRIQIPVIEREEASRDELCGEYINPNGSTWERIKKLFKKKDKSKLSRLERNRLKDIFKLECAQQYYTISIDDVQRNELQFSFYKVNHQWFYMTYIPIENIDQGRHVLKIEKAYKNDDGENAVQFISFFKN